MSFEIVLNVPSLFTVLFFFDYSREQLRQLISNLNAQKSKIKKSGIIVDGRKYNIKFTGTAECQMHEIDSTVLYCTVL